MSENSLIEWTSATWNPLLGCHKCSEGCKLCYAIRTAWRLQHNPNPTIAAAYAGLVEQRADSSLNWTGKINLLHSRLQEPMSWRKPRRIFVNSQSDLFHPDVPDLFIDQVFAVMAACPQHTFQVLTKRPARMAEWVKEAELRVAEVGEQLASDNGWCHAHEGGAWPLPNVWLGVSVENQRAAEDRIPHLLQTPAAVRFLSCEPLLGPLNLADGLGLMGCPGDLDWIICGGESGPGARPMHPHWPRSLREQCKEAGVAFFFKQWGEHIPLCAASADIISAHVSEWVSPIPGDPSSSYPVYRVGKKAAGRLLDGCEYNEFPSAARTVAAA